MPPAKFLHNSGWYAKWSRKSCSITTGSAHGETMASRSKAGKSWYGHGLPYLAQKAQPGHLIVIEGTDGVGRSTQIELLRPWLELEGFAVSNTGWTRSPLLADTIN